MESTGWSVQKSMDMRKIPIDEQKKLLPEI